MDLQLKAPSYGELHEAILGRGIFAELLQVWPSQWDGYPGTVREMYGFGYKLELEHAETVQITVDAIAELDATQILEGTIVEGTDAATRPTPAAGIPATQPTNIPDPNRLADKKPPYTTVALKKP